MTQPRRWTCSTWSIEQGPRILRAPNSCRRSGVRPRPSRTEVHDSVDRSVGSRCLICLPARPRGPWWLPSPEIAHLVAKIWAYSRDRSPRLASVPTTRSHAAGRDDRSLLPRNQSPFPRSKLTAVWSTVDGIKALAPSNSRVNEPGKRRILQPCYFITLWDRTNHEKGKFSIGCWKKKMEIVFQL
jgi:hypothetical protein